MKTLGQYFVRLLVLSAIFTSSAQAESFAPIYNEYLKSYISSSSILKPKQSFGDLIDSVKPVLSPELLSSLESSLAEIKEEQLPRIQVSAYPWVRFHIHDGARVHTLAFVGDNNQFMTLNGEPILWVEARSWETLSARIKVILDGEIESPKKTASLLALLFPAAHAYGAPATAGLGRPLIYSAAAVLAITAVSFFGFKAAEALSKAKTQHEVKVTGIPDKIDGNFTIDGIPSELKTTHEVTGLPTEFNANINTNHEFALKALTANRNLSRLVGSTTESAAMSSRSYDSTSLRAPAGTSQPVQ